MTQTYVVPVQLLVVAKSTSEATDAVSALLSERERRVNPCSELLDWSYIRFGTQYLLPQRYRHYDLAEYQEGDFLA